MEFFGTAIASILVGLVVGVLSGLLGIGGGTLLVPIFKLGYVMDSIACTATSLFTIIPTSLSGALSHIRNKTCVPKLGVAAGLGGAVTSPVGVWLATLSPDWLIMVVAAVVIGYSAVTMLGKALKMPRGGKEGAAGRGGAGAASPAGAAGSGAGKGADAAGASPVGAGEKPVREDIPPAPQLAGRQLLAGMGIGLAAGVASGYVGVGGGFLMVPLMIQLLHIPMKLTSGTSLIAIIILSIPGVTMQAMLGNVNWVAGIAVAVGSIPGAAIGARLIPRVPERTLRIVFGVLLFVAAMTLVVNQLGL